MRFLCYAAITTRDLLCFEMCCSTSGKQKTANPMTQGYFNYVEATTPSSLYTTGKQRARRDAAAGEVRLECIVLGGADW